MLLESEGLLGFYRLLRRREEEPLSTDHAEVKGTSYRQALLASPGLRRLAHLRNLPHNGLYLQKVQALGITGKGCEAEGKLSSIQARLQ